MFNDFSNLGALLGSTWALQVRTKKVRRFLPGSYLAGWLVHTLLVHTLLVKFGLFIEIDTNWVAVAPFDMKIG